MSLLEELKLDTNFRDLSKHPKLDITWLENYPHEKWDWYQISIHPNLRLEWLLGDPKIQIKFNWIWSYICQNPNFKLEWVETQKQLPWDWEIILEIQDLQNPKWLELYPTKIWKYNYWTGVSKNRNLKTELFFQYLQKPWKWEYVVECPQFEFCWLDRYLQEIRKNITSERTVFEKLSKHPQLEISWMEKYPTYPWNFIEIPEHPNFKPDWIEKVKGEWTITDLARYPERALEFINKKKTLNPGYPYMKEFSASKYITLEFIQLHPEIEWEWGKYGISRNPNFNSEWFVVFHHKRKHMHWGEGGLSSHPNFTMEWIKNNRKKAWTHRE